LIEAFLSPSSRFPCTYSYRQLCRSFATPQYASSFLPRLHLHWLPRFVDGHRPFHPPFHRLPAALTSRSSVCCRSAIRQLTVWPHLCTPCARRTSWAGSPVCHYAILYASTTPANFPASIVFLDPRHAALLASMEMLQRCSRSGTGRRRLSVSRATGSGHPRRAWERGGRHFQIWRTPLAYNCPRAFFQPNLKLVRAELLRLVRPNS
jgi:hypothetical protein